MVVPVNLATSLQVSNWRLPLDRETVCVCVCQCVCVCASSPHCARHPAQGFYLSVTISFHILSSPPFRSAFDVFRLLFCDEALSSCGWLGQQAPSQLSWNQKISHWRKGERDKGCIIYVTICYLSERCQAPAETDWWHTGQQGGFFWPSGLFVQPDWLLLLLLVRPMVFLVIGVTTDLADLCCGIWWK